MWFKYNILIQRIAVKEIEKSRNTGKGDIIRDYFKVYTYAKALVITFVTVV